MSQNHKTVQYNLRLPPELKSRLQDSAKKNGRSLNQDIVDRLQQSFDIEDSNKNIPQNIKVIRLQNGIKRYVFGKLVPLFDVDYTNPNLTELRDDISFCLKALAESPRFRDRLRFLNKKVFAYIGSHHIDIVDDGVGSLNWLIVEDHPVESDKLSEY